MGWFDGFFGGQQKSNSSDPLEKLDPKLREFLEKESPVKLKPAGVKEIPTTNATSATNKSTASPSESNIAAPQQQDGAVPKESQFQDGRYAHIWKTYRPQAEVEAETKSDHEKLMDVLEGYKERRSQIGRAALENCALEQLDWTNCMKSGDWTAKLTMCSAQVRKFERCYMMQSRLLKALGYLNSSGRHPSVDEDIQMHADALYHRMLEQEAAIAKAKEQGAPIPKFPPLVTKTSFAGSGADDGLNILSPEAQKKLKEHLETLPEAERAAEEAATKAELRAQAAAASRIQDLWKEKEKERETRKQQGTETIMDKVSGIFRGSSS